jgi:hypothetical protein
MDCEIETLLVIRIMHPNNNLIVTTILYRVGYNEWPNLYMKTISWTVIIQYQHSAFPRF